MEVKRCKTEAADLEDRLEQQIQAYEAMFALWNEFDASLIKVNDVHLGVKKIAGVRVPLLENIDFEIRPYIMFNAPKWYADGIHLLEELARYGNRTRVYARQAESVRTCKEKDHSESEPF